MSNDPTPDEVFTEEIDTKRIVVFACPHCEGRVWPEAIGPDAKMFQCPGCNRLVSRLELTHLRPWPNRSWWIRYATERESAMFHDAELAAVHIHMADVFIKSAKKNADAAAIRAMS